MDKIAQLLRDLAVQLGVAIEYLWPRLVQYHVMSTIAPVIGLALCALFSGLITWHMRIGFEKKRKSPTHYVSDADYATWVVPGCIFIALTIATIITLSCALPTVFAPEGSTIIWLLRRCQ